MDDFRHSLTAAVAAAIKLVLAPRARHALHGGLTSSARRRVKGSAVTDRALHEQSLARRSALSSAFDTSTVEHWSSSRVLDTDLN